MRSATLALALWLLGTGMCSPTQPEAAVDREFVLAPGQTADVSGTGVRVRFDSVVSDNRCPMDANCVQAGDAVVQILVTGGGTSADYQLHTTDAPQSIRHGDLTISLVRLLPYPVSTRTIAAEEYRATLRAARE